MNLFANSEHLDRNQLIQAVQDFYDRWSGLIPKEDGDHYSDFSILERDLYRHRQKILSDLRSRLEGNKSTLTDYQQQGVSGVRVHSSETQDDPT